jgi:hypothetical protein
VILIFLILYLFHTLFMVCYLMCDSFCFSLIAFSSVSIWVTWLWHEATNSSSAASKILLFLLLQSWNPLIFRVKVSPSLYSLLGLLLCKSCVCHPNSPVFGHISYLFIPLTSLFAHPLFCTLAMTLTSEGLVNVSLSNIPFVWKIVSKMPEFNFIVMCS